MEWSVVIPYVFLFVVFLVFKYFAKEWNEAENSYKKEFEIPEDTRVSEK